MSQPSAEPQSDKKNYKDTLNLPVTDFKMKAGAATREPEIEAMWDSQQIYQQAVEIRKAQRAPKFVLHDGPPYLSSDKIHIGTALNKILKDIVTRYKYQRGYFAPYIPGYDSHGLPIENAVAKNIKGGRHAISEGELRKQCRTFALKNLDGQETNFKRLGVWGDWKKPYITMNAEFEATQIKLFYQMYEKGYVYKGLKPVYWSPTSESALAEAEVEYADHTSHSIYVAFPFVSHELLYDLKNNLVANSQFMHFTQATQFLPPNYENGNFAENNPFTTDFTLIENGQEILVNALNKEELIRKIDKFYKKFENSKFVIWTTTPWTLPANLALSVNANFKYVLFETEKLGKLIVAQELLEKFCIHIGIELPVFNESDIFGGDLLERLLVQHPFIAGRRVPILMGDHVTLEAGTGIVHTAPGHGMEDYTICQVYDREQRVPKIGILSPIDNKGCFTADAGERLAGKFYEEGNLEVLEILKENNALLGHNTFVHSYPHDWRTHKPVIYRATEQWFVSIDKIREQALSEIKGVKWIPEKGESRITAMVENRSDWCISRQRVWGVPIPIFYYEDNNDILINQDIIDHLYEQFKVHTSDLWWEKSAEELLAGLPQTTKDAYGIGTRAIKKEMDIMDVWFDSGVTHTTVVNARHEEFTSNSEQTTLPVELYLEGSDQHRGWFQSSLLTSVMTNGKAPYKTVLTHGFVLDKDGRKMSKSLGNVVDPNKVMNQYGADILRLWIASVDYTQDIRIGDNILAQLAETYKKVRNTFRFMLGNLADFDAATQSIPTDQLSRLDQFILYRLQRLVEQVTADFDNYEFHRYNHEIQWFCGSDLSAIYFDITKDILYCDKSDAPRRRAVQTVIHKALLTLLPMLVPIMPHLAEDIWLNLPDKLKLTTDGKILPSVTLLDWPSASIIATNDNLLNDMQALFNFRTEAFQALEIARKDGKIGSALEAKLIVSEPQPMVDDADELAVYCLVSQVEFGTDAENILARHSYKNEAGVEIHITVLPADGEECQRCWKHTVEVATNNGLCARCLTAVS